MEHKPEKGKQPHTEPTIAPGLEDDELHQNATPKEIASGDFTQVTRLSWEENDNGSAD